MSSSTAIAPRRRPNAGCLALLLATAVVASTSAASAGQDAGPVVRNGVSELRFAGAYEAGKVPVVFIHGLLGVPGQWSVMLDRLSREPAIRARYQFLTFRYDSLRSIAESGTLLAQALDQASRRFDPEGRDHCFDRVVVVGHSMGGLVAKAALGALERRCPGPLRTRTDRGGPTRARGSDGTSSSPPLTGGHRSTVAQFIPLGAGWHGSSVPPPRVMGHRSQASISSPGSTRSWRSWSGARLGGCPV